MVEVHLHGRFADLLDDAHHAVALGVAHRNLAALEEDVLGELAVDHEYVFRQVDDGVGDHFAVAVLGLERERNRFADLLAQDRLLEFGEQHARSEDEFERLARTRLIRDLSVNGELVVYADHFVLFYFHTIVIKFSCFYRRFSGTLPGIHGSKAIFRHHF